MQKWNRKGKEGKEKKKRAEYLQDTPGVPGLEVLGLGSLYFWKAKVDKYLMVRTSPESIKSKDSLDSGGSFGSGR